MKRRLFDTALVAIVGHLASITAAVTNIEWTRERPVTRRIARQFADQTATEIRPEINARLRKPFDILEKLLSHVNVWLEHVEKAILCNN